MPEAFNLDTVLDAVLPWTYPVIYRGQTYQTRRPSMGELAVLQKVLSDKVLPEPQQLVQLFDDSPPDVADWPFETRWVFVIGYVRYFAEHTAKKAGRPMAAAVEASLQPVLAELATSTR